MMLGLSKHALDTKGEVAGEAMARALHPARGALRDRWSSRNAMDDEEPQEPENA